MCSYQMANEGVDKREADTCVMATPPATTASCSALGAPGRASTSSSPSWWTSPTTSPSVHAAPVERQRLYSQERYAVQVLPHDADPAAWFA